MIEGKITLGKPFDVTIINERSIRKKIKATKNEGRKTVFILSRKISSS